MRGFLECLGEALPVNGNQEFVPEQQPGKL